MGVKDISGNDGLSLPMSRKDLLPKGKRDRTLFFIMLIMIPLVTCFDLFYVLPRVESYYVLHIFLGGLLLINITVNMWRLLNSTPAARDLPTGTLPAALLPNWFYCHECGLNVPPRSYHCRICDECILKQDHHCMFAGKCVGFVNQRFFVIGLTSILVATSYSVIFHYAFTVDAFLGGFRWKLVLVQMAPHLAWLFGAVDFYGFLIGTINLFEIIVVMFCSVLLYTQVQCLYNNQTMYERKHTVSKYKLPFLSENLKQVFGERYILVWLAPWIDSPPKGDGIHFELNTVEGRKSL